MNDEIDRAMAAAFDLCRSKQYDDARALIQAVATRLADDPADILRIRALVEKRAGERELALELMLSSLKYESKHSLSYFYLTGFCIQDEDFIEAINYSKLTIESEISFGSELFIQVSAVMGLYASVSLKQSDAMMFFMSICEKYVEDQDMLVPYARPRITLGQLKDRAHCGY